MGSPDQAKAIVAADNLAEVVEQWLREFCAAVHGRDVASVDRLFLADGWWRDLLTLTWDFRTFHGATAIKAILTEYPEEMRYTEFALEKNNPPHLVTEDPGKQTIEAFFRYETSPSAGRGVLRLTRDSAGPWKAWTLLTAMQTIRGREQARGRRRPVRAPDPSVLAAGNWADWRLRTREFTDSEPRVVIIGAGHCGLAVAANLSLCGVETLIVEKNDRIGDNWRKRYHSLVLHDPIWADHLPYLPFPDSWPVRTPKDKLGDWLESYASAMDLNVWTGTELLDSSYDDDANRWTVRVRRSDGRERTLHPAHVVLATGVHGEPNVPTFAGMDDYQGQVMHSGQYVGGVSTAGRRAIVVGAGNSAHDIAEDLHRNGAAVTLVQRSSTYIMSQEKGLQVQFGSLFYEGGPPVEDADLISASFPYLLALERAVRQTQIIADLDRDMLAGLERVGYRIDFGKDGGGGLSKILNGPGSYYLDVGCCQLIADGNINVTHAGVERFTETGIRFDDGSEIDADIVVLATGYKNMRETARRLFGDETADRCNPVWGLNDEGEIRTIWRSSGHPGFWFMGGPLYIARFYSRYLALQIQATEEGLLGRSIHTGAMT